MEPKNFSELTMYVVDAFNKLTFFSEMGVELPNKNRSTNSVLEREAILS